MSVKTLQKLLSDKRGQISEIFTIIFMGGILAIILVNVIPLFIDNFISPQLINRDFGTTAILLWELTALVFIALILLAAFNALKRPDQR